MNKLLVRLLVAFLTFSLSLIVTGFKKFLTGNPPIAAIQPVGVAPAADFTADRLQICRIYAEYGPAQTRHDRAFFERIETDNFTLVSEDEQLTKGEDLQWMDQQPAGIVYEVR